MISARPFLSVLFALSALSVSSALPATAQSIAGAWDASMETPGGVRTSRMTLQVEGEKVTGTMARPTGDVAIAGTIVGDTLRFSYTILYNDNPITLSVVALRAVGTCRHAACRNCRRFP
jgi:hypothetical protein